jgi:HTH-type transcriptional regulator/antitoxin HigA
MQTIDIEKTQQAWTDLNQILFIPRTESEENRYYFTK